MKITRSIAAVLGLSPQSLCNPQRCRSPQHLGSAPCPPAAIAPVPVPLGQQRGRLGLALALGLSLGVGLLPSVALGQTQAPQYLSDEAANPTPDSLPPLPQRGLFRPITLTPGFTPDPWLIGGISGGRQEATSQAGRGETETGICWGYISEQPDHRLVLTEFFDYLTVGVASAGDTTLVIQGPGGTWCSDDAQGRDPRIGGQWLPGTYQIWVGSADPDAYFVYDLQLTEVE